VEPLQIKQEAFVVGAVEGEGRGEGADERKFATRLIHFGAEVDEFTGASSVPIYQASTFHHFKLDEPPKFNYSRKGSPTRHVLEDYIASLEGGTNGFAYASGMAAISAAFMLFSAGDHIICSEDAYGGTYHFIVTIMKRMGVEASFVDMTDLGQVEAARRPNTKGVFIETPSNPTLKITDITAVAGWAREHGILSMIDNTFMSPYHQRPLEQGIDIVLHSATKFLCGHSDVLAGLAVVADEGLAAQFKDIQISMGAVLGPQDSWLLIRGMKTLQARMEWSEQSSRRIADWLSRHPAVERVYYPGLPDHPLREVHERQSRGYGAVVSFDVGSEERARQVLKALKVPLVAVSLGAVESIVSWPAKMSHAEVPRELRLERGVSDGLLRYSVGLEDTDDLIADLAAALKS
jgi:cystathionine beta-lyase